jgi:hypothetical protein
VFAMELVIESFDWVSHYAELRGNVYGSSTNLPQALQMM